jgi:hypothetical protein
VISGTGIMPGVLFLVTLLKSLGIPTPRNPYYQALAISLFWPTPLVIIKSLCNKIVIRLSLAKLGKPVGVLNSDLVAGLEVIYDIYSHTPS